MHYTRRALVQLLVLLEWLSGQTDAMHRVTDGAAFLQSEAQQVRCINGEKMKSPSACFWVGQEGVTPFKILSYSPSYQVRVILDRLFYTHRDLFRKQVASRPYDLATAIDVLALGSTFARFPR